MRGDGQPLHVYGILRSSRLTNQRRPQQRPLHGGGAGQRARRWHGELRADECALHAHRPVQGGVDLEHLRVRGRGAVCAHERQEHPALLPEHLCSCIPSCDLGGGVRPGVPFNVVLLVRTREPQPAGGQLHRSTRFEPAAGVVAGQLLSVVAAGAAFLQRGQQQRRGGRTHHIEQPVLPGHHRQPDGLPSRLAHGHLHVDSVAHCHVVEVGLELAHVVGDRDGLGHLDSHSDILSDVELDALRHPFRLLGKHGERDQ